MTQNNDREKRRRFTLAAKVNLVTTGIILLLTAGLLLISYIAQAKKIDSMYRDMVEKAAKTAAERIDSRLAGRFWRAIDTEEFRQAREKAVAADDGTIIQDWLENHHSVYYEFLHEDLAKDPEYQEAAKEAEKAGKEYIDYYESMAFDYEVLAESLSFARESSNVTYVYLQYDRDGVTWNVVDPEENYLYIGSIEEEIPEFQNMGDNANYPATVHRSSYGWMCTACRTVINEYEGNEIEGVVGADIDMNTVMRARFAFLLNSMLFVLVLTILAILANIFLVRKIAVEPLQKLTEAACGFAKTEKKYTVEDVIDLDIRSNDEISDLYHEIRDMQSRIVDYTDRAAQFAAEESRIGTEMELAARIQNSMLPPASPALPEQKEFTIWASMTPARQVGGDFYNCFMADENHLCMIMADVSGKGVPAALFMMACMIFLRDFSVAGAKPSEILTRANEVICANNRAKMFVTVWLGILDLDTGVMTCANAGHEYPVIRGEDGTFRLFKDRHGFVVGGMEGIRYKDYELTLAPGDAVFVYTDGVPETNDADGNFFGTDRMLEALNTAENGHPEAVLKSVRESTAAFAGGADQFDDMTMLCMEYHGKI